jgi:hypothetical protein
MTLSSVMFELTCGVSDSGKTDEDYIELPITSNYQ